jgi:hypothetical protein
MPRLMITAACATAALGLAACNYNKQDYNEANADYNAEGANYADNTTYSNTADYNAINAANATDYNATNATGNAANAANNMATNNSY